MISSSLFVLLLATYAYSIPITENFNMKKPIPELTSPQSAILHLLDDGDSKNVVNLVEPTSATVLDGLRFTTENSFLNTDRVTRDMVESSTLDSTFETSSQAEFSPRGMEGSFTTMEPSSKFSQGMEGSFTTMEPSSKLDTRGMEGSFTTMEPSSKLDTRGIEETTPLYLSTLETSSQFDDRKIRGEKDELNVDLQTTEGPSSSVTSFATTTGLLRGARGEQSEGLESSSMQMDDATTQILSAERPKTVIEVFPGRNTKTEIISGSNIKTEVIPGPNTKTEITSGSGIKTEITRTNSNKLNGEPQPLSEGKN